MQFRVVLSLRKELRKMKENSKWNKHMTLDDRIENQEYIRKGVTFKAIMAHFGIDSFHRIYISLL